MRLLYLKPRNGPSSSFLMNIFFAQNFSKSPTLTTSSGIFFINCPVTETNENSDLIKSILLLKLSISFTHCHVKTESSEFS